MQTNFNSKNRHKVAHSRMFNDSLRLIFFLPFLCLLGSPILLAQAPPISWPDSGGSFESPHSHSGCISHEDELKINAQIEENIKMLKEKGKYKMPVKSMITTLEYPVAPSVDLEWNGFHAISNYVDTDEASGVQDYNCGDRAYDGHLGIDMYLWPFQWHQVQNGLAEVVAAAGGTIIVKEDGHNDDECDNGDGGEANYIVIQHADGSTAWYYHMKNGSLTSKEVGETVSSGEYLGIVSSSGDSSAPHLHFEVNTGTQRGYDYVVEPFYGSGGCNPFNNETWWADEEDYRVPTINAVLTHDADPIFGCPSANEVPNFANTIEMGKQYKYAVYFRDEIPGLSTTLSIIRPDGTTYTSWTHSSSGTYSSSWWNWQRTINTNEPTGTWKFQAELNGEIAEHEFTVDPHTPTIFTTTGTGNWNDASKWDANGIPFYPLPADCSINVNHATGLGGVGSLNIKGTLTWNTPSDDIFLNQSISGTGTLNITGNAINLTEAISMTEAGNLSLTSTRGIYMSNASSISTMNGNMTLNANSGSSSGNFWGIQMWGPITSSGTGNVSLTGKGGNDSSGQQHGIVFQPPAAIQSTGTGSITLNGTSGASNGGASRGVFLLNAGVTIQSVDGNIDITGTSTGTGGQNNTGIQMSGSAKVLSTGSADITMNGIGGGGANLARGILLQGAGTQISSSNGAINLTGNGGSASGDNNFGFACYSNAEVSGTSSATVTIEGTGGDGNGLESGGTVIVSPVSTVNGDLTITGNGGTGTGNFHYGIGIWGAISCTGNGAVTLNGNRGNASANGIHFGSSSIDASGSDVSLNTDIGNITSGSAGTDVVANSLNLVANSGNIGSSGNPFTFDATTLSTNTSTGDGAQFLSEVNSVSVTSMSFGTGSAETVTGTFDSPNTLTCDGTFTIGSGTTFDNKGIIKGTGTIVHNGTFTSSTGSSVNPGASPGILNVTGDYDLGSSIYECEINGTTAGTDYDVLAVSGNAILTNASLNVNWGSFTPSAGQVYTVLTCGNCSGSFSSVTIPPITGMGFTTAYFPDGVQISAALLPVELSEFRVSLSEGATVLLSWKTSSETNNKGFYIQHSSDGQRWEDIGFVNGHGTSLVGHDYSFQDEQPLTGNNYYRLRQVDFNGDFDYSPIRSIEWQSDGLSSIQVYPNPVSTGQLNLIIPENINELSTLRLFACNGQMVLHETAAAGIQTLDVSGLWAGVFLLEIVNGREIWQERVVIK